MYRCVQKLLKAAVVWPFDASKVCTLREYRVYSRHVYVCFQLTNNVSQIRKYRFEGMERLKERLCNKSGTGYF